MHSSTSSSNDRIPVADWGRVWLVGLALFALSLVAWESFWRWQGFHRIPKEQDERQWVLMRKEASQQGEKAVVLIGSSRIMTDIDTDTFAATAGVRPIQLGISGASPIAVLQNLANDKSFRGTVICDFHEVFVYTSEASTAVKLSPDDFLKAYDNRSFLEDLLPKRLEINGKALLKDTFVFQMRELSLSNVLHSLVRGKLPPKPENPNLLVKDGVISDLKNMPESGRDLLSKHFEDMTLEFIRKGQVSADKLPGIVEKVERAVEKISRRGGKVVLVCLPMSGKLWQLNEQYFPKKNYWDYLAANTKATTLHFKDYPSLALYECVDGSHLGGEDVQRFTKSFAEILYGNNN